MSEVLSQSPLPDQPPPQAVPATSNPQAAPAGAGEADDGAERGRSPSAAQAAASPAPAAHSAPPPAPLPQPAVSDPEQLAEADGIDAEPEPPWVLPDVDPDLDPLGPPLPRLGQPPRGRRLVKKDPAPAPAITPQQRLLLLDIWQRSALSAGDFASLVGLSKHTLYAWKKRFDTHGPAGLMDSPQRGAPVGSRLPDLTQRTILMLKQANPSWGCQKISDMLYRGPALGASPSAVAEVLRHAGYELEEVATRPHPDHPRRFERARPNQLWQTDLFTFILKRQNRRLYLVAFMDDHSRFITGFGLHASQSSALVLEVLRAALTNYGVPEEILTDNGSQYVTWRGKSAFAKELEKQGIRQVVAAPRRPQTLGKIERFWGTLWRECLESAIFLDLGDAQKRIGLFIDHYNFQRPHQGLDGLVPADRYLGAAAPIKQTLAARVAANALELARHGLPKTPFYLTGQVGGQPFSVHAEGERVILTRPAGERQEVDLVPPPAEQSPAALPEPVCPMGVVASSPEPEEPGRHAPGTSPLDVVAEQLRQLRPSAEGGQP